MGKTLFLRDDFPILCLFTEMELYGITRYQLLLILLTQHRIQLSKGFILRMRYLCFHITNYRSIL